MSSLFPYEPSPPNTTNPQVMFTLTPTASISSLPVVVYYHTAALNLQGGVGEQQRNKWCSGDLRGVVGDIKWFSKR